MSLRKVVNVGFAIELKTVVNAESPEEAIEIIRQLSVSELLDLIVKENRPSLFVTAETPYSEVMSTMLDWPMSSEELVDELRKR